MTNGFNDYIKQLEELEKAENITSLKAMLSLHQDSFSFFPAVYDAINRIITSGLVTQETIKEIKELLPVISDTQRSYNQLSGCQHSEVFASSIRDLLQRKRMVLLRDLPQYNKDLMDLYEKNNRQLENDATARAAEKRRKEAEERAKKEALEADRRKKEAEEKAKREAYLKEIQALEQKYMQGQSMSVKDKLYLVRNTTNRDVINKLKKSKSISVLEELLKNASISEFERTEISRSIGTIIANQNKKDNEGCSGGCLSSIAIIFGSMIGGGAIIFGVVAMVISVF